MQEVAFPSHPIPSPQSTAPGWRGFIGLPAAPLWIMRPVTTLLLKAMRVAIGPDDPLQEAAIARLHRSGIEIPPH